MEESNYFLRATGEGWHLERNRFDAMLANQAATCGAEVWRNRVLHGTGRPGSNARSPLQLAGFTHGFLASVSARR